MHRWAAFAYGVPATDVTDDQVKRIGAILGAFLGLVGSLTGASVAIYAEWFRSRGIQPKVIEKRVEVPVEVEREVERRIEVEVPVVRHVYVPVPVGDDVDDMVEAIIDALPEAAAAELRSQLPSLSLQCRRTSSTQNRIAQASRSEVENGNSRSHAA